ncbi:MAG: 16S rRNA (uracil(1498)-N(3))-methyltransferase [Planctomycetota bacterium]|nr:16S rRNA (uracil(1498)-N(3))-methyltransferase [Planctomycetaceae bacterium]MDQ3329576.1 16S rRNA (uracil(1498)-N(3))-methyltransferase [Planctomycetota bacterium]
MTERFYLPQPLDRPEVTLSGSEAHHLAHVLRIAAGATVTLFDGEGTTAVAEVLSVSKRDVTLRPRSVVKEPDVAPRITLAVAPPKGDRFRWLVEKATELGVARLVPLLTRRTVVDPRESKLDKLRQTMVAACKQCGRNRLMELTEPIRFESLLSNVAFAGERLILLHPSDKSLSFAPLESGQAGVTLLIGPEGGFTEEETQQAIDRGAEIAALGRTILRTETAAIAAAAVAMHTTAGNQSFSS